MSTASASARPPRCLPPVFPNLLVVLAVVLAAAPVSAGPAPPAGPCALPLPELYERVSPAVVTVISASINPYGDSANQIERHAASGVIVDAAGLILTNSHVVFGQQLVTVTLDDGTVLPARIVGADPVFDIAFLKVLPPAGGTLPAMSAAVTTAKESANQACFRNAGNQSVVSPMRNVPATCRYIA